MRVAIIGQRAFGQAFGEVRGKKIGQIVSLDHARVTVSSRCVRIEPAPALTPTRPPKHHTVVGGRVGVRAGAD